jgi:hypothetical protein
MSAIEGLRKSASYGTYHWKENFLHIAGPLGAY